MWKTSVRPMCPLALIMALPVSGWAQCCPGNGHGVDLARAGLGQSQPPSADMSLDQRWRVHGFERDSIIYFQVNDHVDNVVLVLGKTGDQFWVLPAGNADIQISLPSDLHYSKPSAGASEVYRHPDFSIMVSGAGEDSRWWVVTADGRH